MKYQNPKSFRTSLSRQLFFRWDDYDLPLLMEALLRLLQSDTNLKVRHSHTVMTIERSNL